MASASNVAAPAKKGGWSILKVFSLLIGVGLLFALTVGGLAYYFTESSTTTTAPQAAVQSGASTSSCDGTMRFATLEPGKEPVKVNPGCPGTLFESKNKQCLVLHVWTSGEQTWCPGKPTPSFITAFSTNQKLGVVHLTYMQCPKTPRPDSKGNFGWCNS